MQQNAQLQNTQLQKSQLQNAQIQNAQIQNAQIQNAQLQNAQSYKTPKVTKRPVQQNAQLQNVQCLHFIRKKDSNVRFFLLQFLKVSFLEFRAAARSSNTFNVNLHFKEKTLRCYSAFSVQVTSKRYKTEYLHFGYSKFSFLVYSYCYRTLEK